MLSCVERPAGPPCAACRGYCAEQRRSDDRVADLLVSTWSLFTGRALPHGIPVEELSPEVLIGFWADPAMTDA
jgi:hypothetical protein